MISRSIGTLSIDLIAKMGGLKTGLDKGERQLDNFSKRAKKIGQDIGRSLAVVGTAAAGIAALVVRNTIEAERAQSQLAAALKSTGGAAGISQEQLNAMADELSALTTIEDDAITSAQALMLTFTKIGGEVFPDAIRAAADMSTALGTDLSSAAMQLGKALNDPIKGVSALGRAGVQFSEDQKSMIEALVETGRLAEAQTIILAELETQFGGSAVAARDTLGGALEALKNTVGNLLEGDSGGDGLQAAKEAVEELNTQFSSAQVKSAFAGAIEEASKQLAGLVGWLIKWDTIAGEMLKKADTANAFNSYRESMAGLTEEGGELQKRIKEIEAGGLTGDPFASREESVGKLRDRLREVRIELAAMWKEQNAGQAAGGEPIAAAIDLAGNRARLLGTSGETHLIGPGDSQFEFGIAPRAAKASAAVRDHADSQAELWAELRRVAEEERAQADRWNGIIAQLGGPLAEAEHDHAQRLREIEQAGKDAGASSEEIAAAKFKETQAHRENVAAIEASLNPLQMLLEDMQFEHDLLGLTNAERIAELELRRLGIDMTPKEIAAAKERIKAKAEEYEAAQEAISAMDDFRSSFESNVAGVLDGSKSIKDAFRDMVDDVIAQMARMVAQNFTDSLFGEPGQAGGGSAGGWLSSLFGAFTKRAAGGPVMSGVPYLVGEQGPELIIPSSSGTVIPAGKTAAMMGGLVQHNTFVMPGRYDLRTQAQISADVARGGRRALARGTA